MVIDLEEAKAVFFNRGYVEVEGGYVYDANKWREACFVISEYLSGKWLKQEPCEDAIRRQAVLSYIYNDLGLGDEENGADVERQKELESSYKYVKSLPPVTPQPKTGRWISHREHCENLGVMPSGLGTYEWCSNCDCGIEIKEWHRNNYNFCPNCGAKMVKP